MIKEVFEAIKKVIYIPQREVFEVLFISLLNGIRIWLLTSVIPLFITTLVAILLILGILGLKESIEGLSDLFRDYYYDGTLFGISAWRYHLVVIIFGTLYELFNND